MDAKVKRDKTPRISRQKRIADIISVNWEIVNCGKRGTIKAINTDRTATASNFFFAAKKQLTESPFELSKFDFLARSRTARAAKCYFRVRADHLCVRV